MENNKANVQSVLKEIGFTKHNLWSISETEDYYKNGALIWDAKKSSWTECSYDMLHQEFSEEWTEDSKYNCFEDAYPFILFLTPPSQLSDELRELFIIQPSDTRTTLVNLCVDKDGYYSYSNVLRGVPSKSLPSPKVLLSQKPASPVELAEEVVYLATRSFDFKQKRNLMATGKLTEAEFRGWLEDYLKQVMETVLKDNPELAGIIESD